MTNHGNDWLIASPYGLGDTYLLAALCEAFRAKNGGTVTLMVKDSHRALAEMFHGIDHIVRLPPATGIQQQAPVRGEPFFAHPNFVKVRADWCVATGRMTDAAMYAMILGLDPRTPLSLPSVPGSARMEASNFSQILHPDKRGKTAVVFTRANSWPAVPVPFWQMLIDSLKGEGWDVLVNDPDMLPLRCVIPFCELAGWAIGANSGVMQMIVSSRAACRKTILTESIEGKNYPLPVPSTFPYRYMRTVDGAQYDIEEFRIPSAPVHWGPLCHNIAHGRNALGAMPNPAPQPFMEAPISPGDLIDRLTILQVKCDRLPDKRHLLLREIAGINEIYNRFRTMALVNCEAELYKHNLEAWDANEMLFEANAENDAYKCLKWFQKAHHANQERVRLKNAINAMCGSGAREFKEYPT